MNNTEDVKPGSLQRRVRRLVRIYPDPAIGLPWMGKHGRAVIFRSVKDRGFGMWLRHRDYMRPTLRIAIWWCFDFDVMMHCAQTPKDKSMRQPPNVSDQRPGDRDATKNTSSGIAGFAASNG